VRNFTNLDMRLYTGVVACYDAVLITSILA
jgi:hypothetical protein